MLTEIHRQAGESPIVTMATTVRTGGTLERGDYGDDCCVVPRGTYSLGQLHGGFDIILCGMNKTRRYINRRIREDILQRESHLPEPGDRLVCLRNDHDLGLLNGSLWDVEDCAILDEDEIGLTLRGEENEEVDCTAYRHVFENREIGFFERGRAQEFDYGYALTCHKAQGSQWPAVAVIDESGVFRKHQRNWLYTAITRAAERVSVIR
jgi:exodeoxyribonuclease-5